MIKNDDNSIPNDTHRSSKEVEDITGQMSRVIFAVDIAVVCFVSHKESMVNNYPETNLDGTRKWQKNFPLVDKLHDAYPENLMFVLFLSCVLLRRDCARVYRLF